jgi:hypothetical protein
MRLPATSRGGRAQLLQLTIKENLFSISDSRAELLEKTEYDTNGGVGKVKTQNLRRRGA